MENAEHAAPGDHECRLAGPIHLLQLPLIVALATGAEPPAPDGDGVATLDSVVVVVSSRVPEPLSQVVARVAQVEREELDRHLVRDPEGLVRYMPGVEVVSAGNRFGTRGFSIRGLEGNRVRIVVDGVPLADAYSIRSEEHTSELQSLMRISYAVFCLKKKNKKTHTRQTQ